MVGRTLSETVPIMRGDEELLLDVEFNCSPFIPATGPTYSCGGQPAEGGEIEVEKILLNGREIELSDKESDFVLNYLYENASLEDDGPDPDYRDD